MSKRTFKWVVEIEVDLIWVEDGFDLYNNEEGNCERVEAMLQNDLQWADGSELSARVLKSPSNKSMAKAQGYKTVIDYLLAKTE